MHVPRCKWRLGRHWLRTFLIVHPGGKTTSSQKARCCRNSHANLPKKQRISMETKNHFHLRNLSHKNHCWWNTLLQDPKHHPTRSLETKCCLQQSYEHYSINQNDAWMKSSIHKQTLFQRESIIKILGKEYHRISIHWKYCPPLTCQKIDLGAKVMRLDEKMRTISQINSRLH